LLIIWCRCAFWDNAGRKRVLVVEDELMIRMLLQDMLDDLGHTLAGEAGRIDEAMRLAKQAEFDVAILDYDLHAARSIRSELA
jgi:CheY-like chemotaxis protein